MSAPGEIPKVILPIDPKDLLPSLERLRSHARHLESELKTTKQMIIVLENTCSHEGARTWNTGDGDGSQGFQCKRCGTTGER